MGLALKMHNPSKSDRVSETGKRAANSYVHSFALQLREALTGSNAFQNWEVNAIVDSVVEVLQRDGTLTDGSLAKILHSRGIPKDLANPLAKALSTHQ